MAPKRSARILQVAATNNNNINNYASLSLNDVLCPICRTILIEPVTLPCNHGFCLSCFNNSMENTNLACPLCRLRISSWLRISKKDNKLINNKLWEVIQKKFPQCVADKLQGKDEHYEEEGIPRLITAAGEIRLEYEIEKSKELEEQQKLKEVELVASETYIKKLKDQEDYEESVREENLRLSEQLAKKLSKEYCFDPGPSSSKTNIAPTAEPNIKQTPIDRFLKNVQPSTTPKEYTCKVLNQANVTGTPSLIGRDLVKLMDTHVKRKFKKILEYTSDSNDSIASECRYFKPIDRKLVPLAAKVPIIKIPAEMASATTVIIGAPKGQTNLRHTVCSSAFAVVRVASLATMSNRKIETESINHEDQQLPNNSNDTTITRINRLEHPFNPNNTFTNRYKNTHFDVSNTQQISLPNVSSILDITTIPRKRPISSPVGNKPIKYKRVSDYIAESPIISSEIHFENLSCNSSNIKGSSNHCQEEEDFKLAVKLHKELNNSNRYPTRNNISIRLQNTRKSARQVTMKEISQAAI